MGFCQDWEDDYEWSDELDHGCGPVKPCSEDGGEDDSPKPIKGESK